MEDKIRQFVDLCSISNVSLHNSSNLYECGENVSTLNIFFKMFMYKTICKLDNMHKQRTWENSENSVFQ